MDTPVHARNHTTFKEKLRCAHGETCGAPTNVAKFVFNDGEFEAMVRRFEDVVDQCGLACPKESRQNCDGNLLTFLAFRQFLQSECCVRDSMLVYLGFIGYIDSICNIGFLCEVLCSGLTLTTVTAAEAEAEAVVAEAVAAEAAAAAGSAGVPCTGTKTSLQGQNFR